jgi:hypothetical protein
METCACGKSIVSETDLKRGLCFACHVKGLKFVTPKAFKNQQTIRERQREIEETPAFKAGKIEKIPARAELI